MARGTWPWTRPSPGRWGTAWRPPRCASTHGAHPPSPSAISSARRAAWIWRHAAAAGSASCGGSPGAAPSCTPTNSPTASPPRSGDRGAPCRCLRPSPGSPAASSPVSSIWGSRPAWASPRFSPGTGAESDACFLLRRMPAILVDGRKLVGSAQRRWDRSLLQQGSILLDFDPRLHQRIFPAWPRTDPAAGVTSLRALLGTLPAIGDLVSALCEGWREALGASCAAGDLLPRRAGSGRGSRRRAIRQPRLDLSAVGCGPRGLFPRTPRDLAP